MSWGFEVRSRAGSLAAVVFVTIGSGTAGADALADKSREVTTDDGWHLRITQTDENLDRYPNLAATAFTREGFTSLKAVADPATAPPRSTRAPSSWATIGPHVIIGVTSGVGGSATIEPTVYLKPGTITSIPFGTKALTGRHASITADQVHIKIDGCMGPVSVRPYAQVSISTPTADNSLAVYGDPIYL
jgi:hypothetical protein